MGGLKNLSFVQFADCVDPTCRHADLTCLLWTSVSSSSAPICRSSSAISSSASLALPRSSLILSSKALHASLASLFSLPQAVLSYNATLLIYSYIDLHNHPVPRQPVVGVVVLTPPSHISYSVTTCIINPSILFIIIVHFMTQLHSYILGSLNSYK